MRKAKNDKKTNAWMAGILLALSGLSVAVLAQSQKQDPLKQRAEKIFQMDREYSKKGKRLYPSHELVALSIAMEFGNRDGIRELLSRLENVKVQKN